MRRKPKSKLDGRLRRITRSPDFSAWRRATTRPTSSSASTFWRVCAKPGFRKNDGRLVWRGASLSRRTGHRGVSSATRSLAVLRGRAVLACRMRRLAPSLPRGAAAIPTSSFCAWRCLGGASAFRALHCPRWSLYVRTAGLDADACAHCRGQELSARLRAAEDDRADRPRLGYRLGRRELLRQ